MVLRLPLVVLALSIAAASCGESTTEVEEVVDFSGAWTLRLDFSYSPEDVFCSVTGIALTVVQNGSVLTGGSVGGTQSCSQTGTDWPEAQIQDQVLSGTARPNSAVVQFGSGALSLNLSGQPRSGRFDGTFNGSVFLDAFDLGDVTVSGTWSARR
jgi:hypothetical protein